MNFKQVIKHYETCVKETQDLPEEDKLKVAYQAMLTTLILLQREYEKKEE